MVGPQDRYFPSWLSERRLQAFLGIALNLMTSNKNNSPSPPGLQTLDIWKAARHWCWDPARPEDAHWPPARPHALPRDCRRACTTRTGLGAQCVGPGGGEVRGASPCWASRCQQLQLWEARAAAGSILILMLATLPPAGTREPGRRGSPVLCFPA